MYRKVRVRKNEERIGQDVSAKQREQRNRIRTIQQREDQNLLYSQNFYLFGDAFLGPVFFSVKIGRNFSRGENSRGNSKRFENSEIVANEAWLKRYVGGVPAFPLCFRIYEQGGLFPSIERVAPRERENGNIGTGGEETRKW